MSTSEEFLTLSEVRKRLRICDATVRDLVKSGQLRTVRVGRQHRIPESFLADFVARHANMAGMIPVEPQ